MESPHITIRQIHFDNRQEIKRFLSNAGKSLEHFRYFNSRSLDVLRNHDVTLLAYRGSEPIAYAHLDPENDITWLGIAVSDNFRKKGLGKLLMVELLRWARTLDIKEIHLTVDNDNLPARSLYKKFGFACIKSDNNISHYILSIKNQ